MRVGWDGVEEEGFFYYNVRDEGYPIDYMGKT